MSLAGFLQLGASTLIYLLAASFAKSWALNPGIAKLAITLVLYTLGNLIMLRLVREFGMSIAFSLSAIIQLVAVNLIAFGVFGERLTAIQTAGVALAVVAVALISFGPSLGGR